MTKILTSKDVDIYYKGNKIEPISVNDASYVSGGITVTLEIEDKACRMLREIRESLLATEIYIDRNLLITVTGMDLDLIAEKYDLGERTVDTATDVEYRKYLLEKMEELL